MCVSVFFVCTCVVVVCVFVLLFAHNVIVHKAYRGMRVCIWLFQCVFVSVYECVVVYICVEV